MKLITRLKKKNLTSASFDHYMKLNSGKKNISVKIAMLKIEEISREVKKERDEIKCKFFNVNNKRWKRNTFDFMFMKQ